MRVFFNVHLEMTQEVCERHGTHQITTSVLTFLLFLSDLDESVADPELAKIMIHSNCLC